MDATPQQPLTVRDLIALYFRHSAAKGKHGPESLRDRRATLGWFVEAYGDMLVADCKPYHLSEWVEAHPSWRSSSTRRSKAVAVKAVFNWAFEEERIDRHPFRRVRYANAERRPELPDDVLDKILVVAHKPLERALRFLRLTGCRLGELCRAVWRDINFDRALWTISKHKTRKTTGRAKLVALVPDAIELLRKLRAETLLLADGPKRLESVSLVFLNTRGKPWTRHTLGTNFRVMMDRLGIQSEATLHGIRHQAATAAIAAGASIKLVAAQLGHASVTTTEKYYCHLEGQMDAVRDAFGLGIQPTEGQPIAQPSRPAPERQALSAPSPPPFASQSGPRLSRRDQMVVEILQSAGRRLTTPQLMTELQARGEQCSVRTLAAGLAALSRLGVIENRKDARPPGYQLLTS